MTRFIGAFAVSFREGSSLEFSAWVWKNGPWKEGIYTYKSTIKTQSICGGIYKYGSPPPQGPPEREGMYHLPSVVLNAFKDMVTFPYQNF